MTPPPPPPPPPLSKIRQRTLHDIQHSKVIHLELFPDVVLILIFRRSNDTIATTINDDVDAAEMGDYGGDGALDGFADADVAGEGKERFFGWEGGGGGRTRGGGIGMLGV